MQNTKIKICDTFFDKNLSHFRFRFLDTITNMHDLVHLKEFPNLTSASFNDTNLNDIGLKHITECDKIDNLNLQLTKVSDAGLALLSKLKDLKYLRLKDNVQLTNNCIQHINKLNNLVDLQIHETSIDQLGLEKLTLTKLEFLLVDVWQENHSFNSLTTLSKRMPNCDIAVKGKGVFNNGQFDGNWDTEY